MVQSIVSKRIRCYYRTVIKHRRRTYGSIIGVKPKVITKFTVKSVITDLSLIVANHANQLATVVYEICIDIYVLIVSPPLVTYTRDEISLLVKSIQIAFIFHDITLPRIHSRQYTAQDRLVRCLECNIMCTVDKIGHGNFQRSIGIDYIHHRHITRLVATARQSNRRNRQTTYYQTAVSHTGNHFITFTTSISTILFVGQQSDGDGYLIRIRTICLIRKKQALRYSLSLRQTSEIGCTPYTLQQQQ